MVDEVTEGTEEKVDIDAIKEEVRKETEAGMMGMFTQQMDRFVAAATPAPAPVVEPEAPTNPFSPDDDPVNAARWETEKMINEGVQRVVNEKILPVAEKLNTMAERTQRDLFARQTSTLEADDALDVPEVRRAYDDNLSKYNSEQKADPEVRRMVLDLAKGQNMDAIVQAKTAKIMNANEVDEAPAVRPLGTREQYVITADIAKMAKAFGFEDPQTYAAQLEEAGVAVDRKMR